MFNKLFDCGVEFSLRKVLFQQKTCSPFLFSTTLPICLFVYLYLNVYVACDRNSVGDLHPLVSQCSTQWVGGCQCHPPAFP